MYFKDSETINHKNKKDFTENLKLLIDVINDKEKLNNLLNNDTVHIPDHNNCDYADDDSDKETEKRMCRCMYFCNRSDYPKCKKCKYPHKYHIKNDNVKILGYEESSTYKMASIGGVDLCMEYDKVNYAVEVKPYGSSETILRMIAEILTYTEDRKFIDYKPAIMFSGDDNGEQLQQFNEYIDKGLRDVLANQHNPICVFKYNRTRCDDGYNCVIEKIF